jgi:hypothetical protein
LWIVQGQCRFDSDPAALSSPVPYQGSGSAQALVSPSTVMQIDPRRRLLVAMALSF